LLIHLYAPSSFAFEIFSLSRYEEIIITFFPGINSEIYFNRGLAYFYLKIDNMAMIDFNRAIKYNPKYFSAYLQRGVLFVKQNKNDKAIKDFQKAIELEPTNPGGYLNLGSVLIVEKKTNEACENLKKAKKYGDNRAQKLISEYCN